jgi:hypothetical protein
MLKPHPSAPLEYWFFKVNHQHTALLVDWICRRKLNTGILRISIHSPKGREVLFVPHPAILEHGSPELTVERTAWPHGEVRWHLTLQAGAERIRPQIFPAEQLGVFDLSLVSAPTVAFSGWVEHRGDRFPVAEAYGMLSHYWGRQLPADWWWISANQFDTDISLECTVLRSHVWGTSLCTTIGYLYLRYMSRSRLLIAPPARISVTGTPESFELKATYLRGPQIALKATWRDYGSFGEGIINTLIGDLEVWEDGELLGRARGTAGLERRQP